VTPTFNVDGPEEIEIGSSVTYGVDMMIPYPIKEITFDAFSPLADPESMSVCNVALKSYGSGFACTIDDTVEPTLYPNPERGNYRGTLALGKVINRCKSIEQLDLIVGTDTFASTLASVYFYWSFLV